MTEIRPPAPELRAVRTVGDAETLKALADPLRLALLTALMRTSLEGPRIMSVKELAAELGEPPTKLYRHVRQLEAANLIRVAASRMVSGILEHRYQACQQDLRFGRDLIREQGTADDATTVLSSLFDAYRDRFFAAIRADQLTAPGQPPGPAHRKPLLSIVYMRVPEARAAELYDRVQQLIGELREPEPGDEGSVPVHALIAFNCVAESESRGSGHQEPEAPGHEPEAPQPRTGGTQPTAGGPPPPTSVRQPAPSPGPRLTGSAGQVSGSGT
jgi:DNA-binding transcriptional ArsR family regulator